MFRQRPQFIHALLHGLAVAFLLSASAGAQPTACTQTKVLGPPSTEWTTLGESVAIDGDVGLVGMTGDNGNGTDAGAVLVQRWDGSDWVREQILRASDGGMSDQFGISVSVFGDVALIGAETDSDDGMSSGSAYVFRYDGATWVEEQKLTADDAEAGDFFGSDVAVHGDTAVITARLEEGTGVGRGAVYVFRYDGSSWNQEQKLHQLDATPGVRFGRGLACSGDVIVAGIPSDGVDFMRPGSAHVYRFDGSTWVFEQKLVPSDGDDNDRFGRSLDIEGELILVGSRGDDDRGAQAGAAYVFRHDGSTWVEEAKLLPSTGTAGLEFGTGTAITAGMAVVGSPFETTSELYAGAAHVFLHDGREWTLERIVEADDARRGARFGEVLDVDGGVILISARLDGEGGFFAGAGYFERCDSALTCSVQAKVVPDRPVREGQFGRSVAVDGGTVLIGSTGSDEGGVRGGAVFVQEHDGSSWTEVQRLEAADRDPFDEFGFAVALSSGVAVVGAPGDDDVLPSAGSAYVFRRDASGWGQEQKLTASDAYALDSFGGSVAVSGDVAVVGAPSEGVSLNDDRGAVYVFRYDGGSWVEEQKLRASDGIRAARFGRSVSVHGDVLLVGAYLGDIGGVRTGSAYAFRYDGQDWIEERILTAPAPRLNGGFGWSVSLDGDLALVGSPWALAAGTGVAGAVHAFRYDGVDWRFEDELVPGTSEAGDLFGAAVAVDGNLAWIGSLADSGFGAHSGQAHLFRQDGLTWREELTLAAGDGDAGDRFSSSVALSGNVAVAGARLDSDFEYLGGSAYIHHVRPSCAVNTAPLCDLGPDVSSQCDGVDLRVDASDEDGDPLSYSWSSDCGASFFPADEASTTVTLGGHCAMSCTVSVTVDDGNGGTCTDSLLLTVNDEQPPVLSVPADITEDATSPTGAVVTYAATATDNCDGPVPPTCMPASGTEFPIGTTTVNCSAQDSCGNTASGTFEVTILSAEEQLRDLIDRLPEDDPLARQVADRLEGVLDMLERGKVKTACNRLNALLNFLRARLGGDPPSGWIEDVVTTVCRVMVVLDCDRDHELCR